MTNKSRLPLGLKIFLAAFSLTLAAYNTMHQGAYSLLYFCNVALFLATFGICVEDARPVSMAAVGVVVIQLLWSVDLLLTAADLSPVRMTAFMLNDNLSPFKKGLATFHVWLPFALLFALSRLGYDRRALAWWTLLTWALLLVSYLFLPRPPAPAHDPSMSVNVNFVFGLNMSGPQQRMPELVWLAGMMIVLPLFAFLPAHAAFRRWLAGTRGAVT
ncbi:MAG TPA: hypothetical protein VFU13_12935 [Steroidobacteraceae bacterium]|nr:hypothetical protein [Steroidobacteraceae bacterium]